MAIRKRGNRPLILSCLVILLAGLIFSCMALAEQQPYNGDIKMKRSELAQKKMQEPFEGQSLSLEGTDPDLTAIRDSLLYGEIALRGTLNDKIRELITLAVLTANQTPDGIKSHVKAALHAGATPVEIKETLYQCAPYIGFPKTETALRLVNEVFAEKNIPLPLKSQSTVTEKSRYTDGLKVQKSIFGEAIDAMHRNTPENQKPIVQNYLSAFCFGDIYTRTGLDIKTRELLTFAIISTLGGCENQVKAHVQGNINVGNSKKNLIDVLAQCLPYIGFPRTLNALACVNAVIPENNQEKYPK